MTPSTADIDGTNPLVTPPPWLRTLGRRSRHELEAIAAALPRPAILLVTSADRGEGKSSVAALLATALAEDGRRVLLVDAHPSAPAQHRLFGALVEPGLHELLLQGEPFHRLADRTAIPGLLLLSRGGEALELEEAFGEARLLPHFNHWRRHFDHVLIDGPPFDQPPCPTLARHCDGVIAVAEAGRTPPHRLTTLRATLQAGGAVPLGAILNRRGREAGTARGPERLHQPERVEELTGMPLLGSVDEAADLIPEPPRSGHRRWWLPALAVAVAGVAAAALLLPLPSSPPPPPPAAPTAAPQEPAVTVAVNPQPPAEEAPVAAAMAPVEVATPIPVALAELPAPEAVPELEPTEAPPVEETETPVVEEPSAVAEEPQPVAAATVEEPAAAVESAEEEMTRPPPASPPTPPPPPEPAALPAWEGISLPLCRLLASAELVHENDGGDYLGLTPESPHRALELAVAEGWPGRLAADGERLLIGPLGSTAEGRAILQLAKGDLPRLERVRLLFGEGLERWAVDGGPATYFQVAAYPRAQEAQARADRDLLRAYGWPALIRDGSMDGVHYRRVLTGPFRDRETAFDHRAAVLAGQPWGADDRPAAEGGGDGAPPPTGTRPPAAEAERPDTAPTITLDLAPRWHGMQLGLCRLLAEGLPHKGSDGRAYLHLEPGDTGRAGHWRGWLERHGWPIAAPMDGVELRIGPLPSQLAAIELRREGEEELQRLERLRYLFQEARLRQPQAERPELYYQVSTFRSPRRAETERALLEAHGWPAQVLGATRDGVHYRRVLTGPFADRAEAVRHRNRALAGEPWGPDLKR